MPDPNTTDDAPPPRGPFFTNWGPLDGPILGRDESPALGVLADRTAALPIGIAYPVGLVEHRWGPVQTFRLVVNKVEMPGRWIWVGRENIPLGEAVDELSAIAEDIERTEVRRAIDWSGSGAYHVRIGEGFFTGSNRWPDREACMDRDEALRLLGGSWQGRAEWNRRRDDGEPIPDLSGADLSAVDLSEANLSDANLSEAKLGGADLREANLSRAHLGGADLRKADLGEANRIDADLIRANLSGARLRDANLTRAKLIEAQLDRANLFEAQLHRANLNGAHLHEASLGGAYLSDANLGGAYLHRAYLSDANLSGAYLSDANLGGAYLHRARLIEAKLDRADLSDAELIEVNFGGADLSEANLTRTHLSGADLTGAHLTGAKCNRTVFANVNFSKVEGLDSVKHDGPSTVGTDTLFLSGGKINETFLRGCGVPEPLIVNLKSLIGALDPIQFYNSFISYGSADRPFVDRLYADLQAKGIRCWLDREDLKIGDPIRPRIDEAIRLHDKLMLVLSASSLSSPWVEGEVEAALERERRQKQIVLFPIRIDDAVMDTDTAWAAHIRRTRHIGEFTGWKDHDAYQTAFARLLRDLRKAAGQAEGTS